MITNDELQKDIEGNWVDWPIARIVTELVPWAKQTGA
jgi:hypothetical protein